MPWNRLLVVLMFVGFDGLNGIKKGKSSQECFAELQCDDQSQNLPLVVQGLQGLPGSQGVTGLPGPKGPQGLIGPPGRDGYTDLPFSFHSELQHLFVTKNPNNTLRPWKLTASLNTPDVLNYFSEDMGIFTAPTNGLYQFFLTIAVSRAKAFVYIAKNGQRMCPIRIESIATIHNGTYAWGWSSGSIDCLIYCQIGDQISIVGSNEKFHSYIYGYSYSTFSGYILFNN